MIETVLGYKIIIYVIFYLFMFSIFYFKNRENAYGAWNDEIEATRRSEQPRIERMEESAEAQKTGTVFILVELYYTTDGFCLIKFYSNINNT